uniref:Uncharacterized protein n=1 Tax=Picea glauca TaxID=3330 RepID=A0A101M029_PICGL|nr:hypothetical protein ABT39_MTgene4435 [Picea glauca]QHR88830.1 hypothetical protein Q903MT_gene2849 [Picea sitchensis]
MGEWVLHLTHLPLATTPSVQQHVSFLCVPTWLNLILRICWFDE